MIKRCEKMLEEVNEEYDILLMKFDSKILFPLRVMYKRNKKEIDIIGKLISILLLMLMVFILFKKFNN